MRDFNPEQQYEDGSFREIAPRGYPDATANEWDDLTPLEELVVAECKATYLRVRPARLPLVGAWMDRILERLPRRQTFATAADLTAWLSAQYREQQRQCPTWPHHWCDMMLIRELAFERYADAAAEGRSYSSPRAAA